METYYIRNKNVSTPIITILKWTRQRTKTYLHEISGRDTIVPVCQRRDAVHPDISFVVKSRQTDLINFFSLYRMVSRPEV